MGPFLGPHQAGEGLGSGNLIVRSDPLTIRRDTAPVKANTQDVVVRCVDRPLHVGVSSVEHQHPCVDKYRPLGGRVGPVGGKPYSSLWRNSGSLVSIEQGFVLGRTWPYEHPGYVGPTAGRVTKLKHAHRSVGEAPIPGSISSKVPPMSV